VIGAAVNGESAIVVEVKRTGSEHISPRSSSWYARRRNPGRVPRIWPTRLLSGSR
jgi:hypothetical protein